MKEAEGGTKGGVRSKPGGGGGIVKTNVYTPASVINLRREGEENLPTSTEMDVKVVVKLFKRVLQSF